jgi:hypothetical protein
MINKFKIWKMAYLKKTLSYCFILVFLLTTAFILSACNENRSAKHDNNTKLNLKNYYPLSSDSYWSYDWENTRGDRWHGAIKVVSMSVESPERKIFVIVDTTVENGESEVSSSAYLWDDEGLKHLYRIAANGDSARFNPPRIVIPTTMQCDSIYRYNYHYEVYSPGGNMTFKGDVQQKYKLHEVGSVETGEKSWKDAVAIESLRQDDFPNGESIKRRALVWYAKDVGPVKIISGIPTDIDELVGDMTGILADWR